jgi:4-hydroxy-3-methylbut-2-enyl diphosphate reductase
MLIVGGRDSANTRRLYEVCRKVLRKSNLVEDEESLRFKSFVAGNTIGITSGASTPDWAVKRVVNKAKLKGKSKKVKGK